jgi:hypothetical protein
MHAEAKTGMRPIGKRAYKRGGAVAGEKSEARADRAPRKSGGSIAIEMMNRDQKAANQERDGVKHTGGLARGGKAKPAMGRADNGNEKQKDDNDAILARLMKRAPKVSPDAIMPPNGSKYRVRGSDDGLKRGGRAAKADGGSSDQMIDPRKVAEIRMKAAADRAGVAPNRFGFTGVKPGIMASAAGMKKGGNVEGSAKDMAEDKALAKKHGMTMAQWEKSAADKKHDRPQRASGGKTDDQFPPERGDDRPPMPARDGGDSSRNSPSRPVIDLSSKLGKYAKGGAAHPASCKCKQCGGRVERASGGRTKSGKTNVNIVIATGGKPQGAPGDMLPPSMMARPPGVPVAVPPPGGAGAPAAMPMPVPMPMPPGGGAPMPRKSGGRTYRSYKDMDAGALSGLGRLEKTEIQAHKR